MSHRRQAIIPLLILCALLHNGCASTYLPREPGRIHLLRTTWGRVAEKDGTIFSISPFSDDIANATKGNPRAQEHARKFITLQRTALGMVIVAAAALVPVVALSSNGSESRNGNLATSGLTLLSGVSVLGAIITFASGRHHLWDAINIYNDEAP